MKNIIKLAISTCPNDTFAFHGLLNGKIDLRGLRFQTELHDIAQLNHGLLNCQFDVVKASYYAGIKSASNYFVLPSGSAIGFGNGPLLLAATDDSLPTSTSQLTMCPGENTTATLLFRMFYGNTRMEQVVFSKIMPALQSKQADFGVCIHEGRFTFGNLDLHLIEDLGLRWERETDSPLPLGGIFAKKSLSPEISLKIQNVISDSIQYAMANRAETLDTMRQYAMEFDDDVLFKHVDLYVNESTINLGYTGKLAIRKMAQMAKQRIGASADGDLEIFGDDQ